MTPPRPARVASLLSLLLMLACANASTRTDGWVPLFDGKTLDGWKASDTPSTFSVADGKIVVRGDVSHLFYTGPVANHDFTNFELKLDLMTKPGANSGVYFHTVFQPTGFPSKGYEVQVNNSHSDPKKTAGLYAIQDNLVPFADNEWLAMTIRVDGKRVVTTINGRVISDYTEPPVATRPRGPRLSHGTFALQGHDPASEVHYRNIMVRVLP